MHISHQCWLGAGLARGGLARGGYRDDACTGRTLHAPSGVLVLHHHLLLASGIRTLDNCYGLVHDAKIVSNSIRMSNEDLWRQMMGNASYKQLSIVLKNEAVLGIPKLNKVVNIVYGPCQLGKQTKA